MTSTIGTFSTRRGFAVPDRPTRARSETQDLLIRGLPQGARGKVVVGIGGGQVAPTQMTVKEATRLLDQKARKGAFIWIDLESNPDCRRSAPIQMAGVLM
jgi:hypothetical protein